MGGCFVFYVTKQTERSKAETEFQRLADASRYESGHSYSGEIGIVESNLTWATGFWLSRPGFSLRQVGHA